ncbi:MAG: hypothetical protein B7Z26_09585, partial [Asticcacaulis sp. 32-58-5]
MRAKVFEIVMLVGGLFASLLPLGLSVYLVNEQGLALEHAMVQSYAQDAMRRSNATADQVLKAFDKLTAIEQGEGECGPKGLAELHRLDLGSSYIQGVGKLKG